MQGFTEADRVQAAYFSVDWIMWGAASYEEVLSAQLSAAPSCLGSRADLIVQQSLSRAVWAWLLAQKCAAQAMAPEERADSSPLCMHGVRSLLSSPELWKFAISWSDMREASSKAKPNAWTQASL